MVIVVLYCNSLSMFQSVLQYSWGQSLVIKILRRTVKSNYVFRKKTQILLLLIYIFQTLKTELYDKNDKNKYSGRYSKMSMFPSIWYNLFCFICKQDDLYVGLTVSFGIVSHFYPFGDVKIHYFGGLW